MEEFIQAVKASIGTKSVTSVGVVKAINGTTCLVEREDLPELFDVRLTAVTGDFDTKYIIYPKVGSEVLVLEIENAPEETAIIKYTEVDRVELKIEEFEFDADKNGLTISNQGENLKECFNDMIDELNKILVIQGNTINIPAMNAIKQRINKILK